MVKIESWAKDVERSASDSDPVEFTIPQPPPVPRPKSHQLNLSGLFASDQVSEATEKLGDSVEMDEEDKADLACYLLSNAVSGNISLNPTSIEGLLINYVVERFSEKFPPFHFRLQADDLSDALRNATSEGQEVADVAMANICE